MSCVSLHLGRLYCTLKFVLDQKLTAANQKWVLHHQDWCKSEQIFFSAIHRILIEISKLLLLNYADGGGGEVTKTLRNSISPGSWFPFLVLLPPNRFIHPYKVRAEQQWILTRLRFKFLSTSEDGKKFQEAYVPFVQQSNCIPQTHDTRDRL